ncbi:hypothetical protein [Parahaliea aestuarii]|uniref:Uncharacterized protein n=1 Tax=Parahaliea aestuarii TaxID=1852021 RepID=A0A5C9A0U0_9GAMM|nr:hypothetical protein [Parahaliea aestuarii]TXS93217.1 hypothetical protein FVW59_05055 [Parahaliea aestuarii]
MFFRKNEPVGTDITFWKALRHLVAFQLKLAADAVRDIVMSPLSVLAFFLDAVRSPTLEDSFYLRLMLFGRRTDRFINLFDEYKDKGHATMDEAIENLESMATRLVKESESRSRE